MFLTRVSRSAGWILPALALITFGGMPLATTGCGGGGGGGGSQQVTLSGTRAATIRVVQQSRSLPVALGILQGDLTAGRATSRVRASKPLPYATMARLLWSDATARSRQENDLTYLPELDLYARTTEGTTSLRYDLYEDAAGRQGAGSIVASATGLNTARVTANVTGGPQPIRGTLNLTQLGNNAIRTVGTLRLTEENISYTADVTTQDDGATTGTLSIADSDGTIRYRNLEVDSVGNVDADLEYRNATGALAQTSQGSGQVRLNYSDTQRYEAAYNSDGSGTLTLFGGSSGLEEIEVVSDFDAL